MAGIEPQLARKPRLATVWLGGCSGCHMSFLDLDERLLELTAMAELVYSPIMDIKVFPEQVDVTLVEGAVANEDNLQMLKQVRQRSTLVAAFGDCAITGNVTAMRNTCGGANAVLERAYNDKHNLQPHIPAARPIVPPLLLKVLPLHHLVTIDCFIPGCPPSADRIYFFLQELLAGRVPDQSLHCQFG